MTEALNLRNMLSAQTPLLGEENTPLHEDPRGGTGFEGATPRHQVAFTPNPLVTPRPGLADGTPGVSVAGTPLRTPMRDNLRINREDGTSSIGDTPRERRIRANDSKKSLRAAFESLPAPANDYEVLVPEDEDDETSGQKMISEEDAAERDARLKRKKEEEERKALARRSAAVALGLPRPANIDVDRLLNDLAKDEPKDDMAAVRQLIDVELVKLMQHDSIAHPIPGTARPGATQSFYEPPDDGDVATAKDLVHIELATLLGYPDANAEAVKKGVIALAQIEEVDDSISWARERERLAYNGKTRTWVDPTTLSLEERIAGAAAQLEQDREMMAKEASKASKAEKKLNLVLGGYQMRYGALSKRVNDAFSDLQRMQIDLASFERLHINESATAPRRVQGLKEEVERLEARERRLQSRYQELQEELRERQMAVSAAEERIMAEAEALNDAALEAEEAMVEA